MTTRDSKVLNLSKGKQSVKLVQDPEAYGTEMIWVRESSWNSEHQFHAVKEAMTPAGLGWVGDG